MNREVYKEMCSQIYDGEDWDRMIDCLERKDKEIERLKNILDRLGLLDKDIDKETKIVNMTVTLPKWLKDIGKKNKINFSKLLQESLYEVLQIGSGKE